MKGCEPMSLDTWQPLIDKTKQLLDTQINAEFSVDSYTGDLAVTVKYYDLRYKRIISLYELSKTKLKLAEWLAGDLTINWEKMFNKILLRKLSTKKEE